MCKERLTGDPGKIRMYLPGNSMKLFVFNKKDFMDSDGELYGKNKVNFLTSGH